MSIDLARQAAELLILQDIKLGDHNAKILVPLSELRMQLATGSQYRWGARQLLVDELKEEGSDKPVGRLVTFTFVTGCRIVRLLESGAPPPTTELPSELLVAELTAEFRAVYKVKENAEPPQEALEAFARLNIKHHIWPWWREWLSATTSRMGLPQVMLPIRLHGTSKSEVEKPPEKRRRKPRVTSG